MSAGLGLDRKGEMALADGWNSDKELDLSTLYVNNPFFKKHTLKLEPG